MKGFKKGFGYDDLDELWGKYYRQADTLRDTMLKTEPLHLMGLILQIWGRNALSSYGDSSVLHDTYNSIQNFFGKAPRNSGMIMTWLFEQIKSSGKSINAALSDSCFPV